MKHKKIILIIGIVSLLFCFIIVRGCTKYTIDKYEEKSIGDLLDKNVEIKYFTKKNQCELFLKFEQKEIPLEIPILSSTFNWGTTIDISGQIQYGSITVSVNIGEDELWKKQYVAGIIEDEGGLELYDANYTLILTFQGAQEGDIHLSFKTHKFLGIF